MKKFLKFIEIGYIRVSLYVIDSNSSYCQMLPNSDEGPVICVGIDQESLNGVANGYIHEAIELCCMLNGTRYQSTSDISSGHDSFVFMYTHPQLSHMSNSIAEDLFETMDMLRNEYNNFKGVNQ